MYLEARGTSPLLLGLVIHNECEITKLSAISWTRNDQAPAVDWGRRETTSQQTLDGL